MRSFRIKSWNFSYELLLGIAIAISAGCQNRTEVDYNLHVKPILNARCISCHGGVKQNGGFSLLTRDLALQTGESGARPIVPGSPRQSAMLDRIASEDPEFRMPLDASPLPDAEIELLKRWIKEGAKFSTHWAYRPLKPVSLPSPVRLGSLDQKITVHPVDQFVRSRLEDMQLAQNSKADPATLLRRISLDLIGLPAPKSIADQYLNAQDDDRESDLIDSLLALPQFGEKWASMWLDLARYADSKGYERDPHRNIWRYRDWVIRAFNKDMPYDQFIVEQLAGDLLPQPTDQQLLATAFHRNTSTNDEGGTDNEEYRIYAVFDRVNTTYEALLGTTMACVQCHSHPYDPILHDDYYKSMHIFNNSRDGDTSPDYPLLRHFSSEDSTTLDTLATWMGNHLSDDDVQSLVTFIKTWMPAYHSIETDSLVNAAHYDMKYLGLRQNGSARLSNVDLTEIKNFYIRYRTNRSDGTLTLHRDKRDGSAFMSIKLPSTDGKWAIHRFDLSGDFSIHDVFLQYTSPSVKADDDRPQVTFDWLRFDPVQLPWHEDFCQPQIHSFFALLHAEVSGTPIMMENPQEMTRSTHRFERGNFLVPAEKVEAGIPAALGKWPNDLPKNRLGFARWIVSDENPLAARTWVNRVWAQVFGRGLVETVEDLGSQGSSPSHPLLLDWLAWEMIHTHEWSLKKFLKMIMLSETYQQSAQADHNMLRQDPENIYLARSPRVRLTAEQIRDQALHVSGLLNSEMHGPSVMPHQPVQWNIPYSAEKWRTSEDGQQYRRAIYTYWKRSSPYPAMMIYDSAERSVCTARRIQTNTPLHALVTLNDSVFMEASAHFGQWMAQQADSPEEQISAGYLRALNRDIPAEELDIFMTLYRASLREFSLKNSNPEEIVNYIDENTDDALAALIIVANSMMNLDEFIMKN